MVVLMGLILVVWYVCSIVKGGLFRPLFLESKELEKELESQQSRELNEKSTTLVLKFIGVFFLGLTIFVIYIVFMVCALKIDTLLLPTVFMMVWTVANFIKTCVSKKEKEKINNRNYSKPNNKTRFTGLISLIYVVYILILIIITI